MGHIQSDPLMVIAESRIDDFLKNSNQCTLVKQCKTDTYHIPEDIAHHLCEEVRDTVHEQLFSQQFWRCQRCMLLKQNGLPRGLATDEKNHYCCSAIAKRYGYDLS